VNHYEDLIRKRIKASAESFVEAQIKLKDDISPGNVEGRISFDPDCQGVICCSTKCVVQQGPGGPPIDLGEMTMYFTADDIRWISFDIPSKMMAKKRNGKSPILSA
jgi:hypothetical protein